MSSRTLFFLARRSSFKGIRNTIGRTNNGHTPLAAILLSFVPGLLTFLVVGAAKTAFQEVLKGFFPSLKSANLSSSLFSCLVAFIPVRCFASMQANVWLFSGSGKGKIGSGSVLFRWLTEYRMKLFPNTIDRNRSDYRDRHYRAHWQPMWAIIGLVLCTLLLLSLGWGAVYDLCAKTQGVTKEDSIVDLAAAYPGVSHTSSIGAEFVEPAEASKSQPYSLACTWYISSCTRQKSNRIPLSGTSGSQPTYPTKQVLAFQEDGMENWEQL